MQCTQASLKISTLTHLITNLAYRLKPHHTRNQYLRAKLDTCADVNIIPVSVYILMFKDPELKKLTSSNMEIGTYTTDIVKIVGLCKFYLVHPDTKKLQEVTFFVARNDGSVDASFFYITITVLRLAKFYVFRLFVVVSTSSVVWSQVRRFFLMRNVFHAINHDE